MFSRYKVSVLSALFNLIIEKLLIFTEKFVPLHPKRLQYLMIRNHFRLIIIIFVLTFICSCSVSKYVSEDNYYLKEVRVTSKDEKVKSKHFLSSYVQQSTNKKIFGVKLPLKVYTISGTDTTKWMCRMLRKLGEAPVLYDSIKAARTEQDILQTLANAGYMKASIQQHKKIKDKKMSIVFDVEPGTRYYIRYISRDIADPQLRELICGSDTLNSLLKEEAPFDINVLSEERSRISKYLRNIGYYKFTKDDIRFSADTIKNQQIVDVTLRIGLHVEDGRSTPTLHEQYRIGNITYLSDIGMGVEDADTIHYKGTNYLFKNKPRFRPSLLTSNTQLNQGELFNDSHLRKTYSNFTRLSAVSFSNVYLEERKDTSLLDAYVIVNHSKPHSLGFDVEATNSAGDLGAAVSASVAHKNFFKGSETFMIKLRGAYEAITGLEGYDGHNYYELGGEMRLSFPSFLLPYVHQSWATEHSSTSEISLQYNMQDRPEFRRHVLTAAWRYRWTAKEQRESHKFDLLEVNYVNMPWISKTFKEEYLDSLGKTNAILKYNYENILITKLGYTYTYNSLGTREQTYGKNAYTIRFNIETSGNLLQGITSMYKSGKNEYGQKTFCGIAFAQYVKGDFDFAKSFKLDKDNSIAMHIGFGIAYPYGNTSVLPFEKRYFSGGANSVRGWSIRSLGPGSYNGVDKGINFINQSGDIKLDLNLEYRVNLFWKFSGAAFVDAGNIWTIREYEDQPGGAFRFDKFWNQIAVSYGLGLRMNLSFFLLRFDAGMKAINPAYSGKDYYPIINPKFSRDFAFHFAVGLPF